MVLKLILGAVVAFLVWPYLRDALAVWDSKRPRPIRRFKRWLRGRKRRG